MSDSVVVREPGSTIIVGGDTGETTAQRTFIQATAPTLTPVTYLWVQTGMGTGGTDFTFWIEDGT